MIAFRERERERVGEWERGWESVGAVLILKCANVHTAFYMSEAQFPKFPPIKFPRPIYVPELVVYNIDELAVAFFKILLEKKKK